MEKVLVYTDGGARGNPGPAAIGVVVYFGKTTRQKIANFGKKIGNTTNNVAEYTAVVEALKWLSENLDKFPKKVNIDFFLDSRLVVNQLNGRFKIKNQKLINLLFIVKGLEQKIRGELNYRLIPRQANYEADKLVNEALDKT
jgi:ribonuclease HI